MCVRKSLKSHTQAQATRSIKTGVNTCLFSLPPPLVGLPCYSTPPPRESVCAGGQAGIRDQIFSASWVYQNNILTHGAPLVRFACWSSAKKNLSTLDSELFVQFIAAQNIMVFQSKLSH